jgi:hypothetical protein
VVSDVLILSKIVLRNETLDILKQAIQHADKLTVFYHSGRTTHEIMLNFLKSQAHESEANALTEVLTSSGIHYKQNLPRLILCIEIIT